MQDINTLQQAVVDAEAAYKLGRAGYAKAKKYDAIVNEGGEGYSTYEAMSEANYSKHAPLIKSAKDALFAAIWTPEVFAARRAGWNARIVGMKTYAQMEALEKQLGYNVNDLKKAKALLDA